MHRLHCATAGVLIRRFRPGEEEALHRVFHGAVHRVAARDYTPEQCAAWAPEPHDAAQWETRVRDIHPFVAEIDGALAGYADVQPSGYITHFFVSAEFPRRGVGRALMARIHEEATRLGLLELTADVSVTAEAFFVACGFQVVVRKMPVRRGVAMPNARMRKGLAAGPRADPSGG